MTLTVSCTTSAVIDSITVLKSVQIKDVSSLTRSEKESLAYNKCLIDKAKQGKFSKKCKKLVR